ncbi:MAG: helix-turn-helix domain-containing protein [Pseudomonadota bacterium]
MDSAALDISWRSALLAMLVAPLVLLGMRLWFHQPERTACRWLAALFLMIVLECMPQILGFSGAYRVWPGLTFAPFSYELWFGPLVYLHAHALMDKRPLGMRWLWLAPGAAQLAYYLWAFSSLGDYRSKWAYNDAVHEPYVAPAILGGALILALVCAGMTWRLIRQYREFLVTTQSTASDLDPSWLARLLGWLGLVLALWLGFEVVDYLFGPLGYVRRYPMFVLIAAALSWTGFEALARIRQPYVALRPGLPVPPPPAASEPGHDWSTMGRDLVAQIRDNQWFLEPGFSLANLARRAGLNESYASRAINRGLSRNFNQVVNEARVQYACERLLSHPDETILDVAHASGFSAKATFNRVFRADTGLTPTAWRRSRPAQNVSKSVNHG